MQTPVIWGDRAEAALSPHADGGLLQGTSDVNPAAPGEPVVVLVFRGWVGAGDDFVSPRRHGVAKNRAQVRVLLDELRGLPESTRHVLPHEDLGIRGCARADPDRWDSQRTRHHVCEFGRHQLRTTANAPAA